MTVNRKLIAVTPWLLVLLATTALVGGGKPDDSPGRLTREQARILSHLSIVYLDDGKGNEVETIRISGVNVQIVNGLGGTATTSGAGNLIVGYDEDPGAPEDRSGSHNLVVGTDHTFNSYGGFVAGQSNGIVGEYSSVAGGRFNSAAAKWASIGGGSQRGDREPRHRNWRFL